MRLENSWISVGSVELGVNAFGTAHNYTMGCDIPGHPAGPHGGHPGCLQHGDMHLRDGMWYCWGFDGEGCKLADGTPRPPFPDHWLNPQGPIEPAAR